MTKIALLLLLAVIGVAFVAAWAASARRRTRAAPGQAGGWPTPLENATGFVTTRPAERKRRPHPRCARTARAGLY